MKNLIEFFVENVIGFPLLLTERCRECRDTKKYLCERSEHKCSLWFKASLYRSVSHLLGGRGRRGKWLATGRAGGSN